MNPYYKLYDNFLGPKILTEIETLKAQLKKGAKVGLITPAAREAARRRQVAMRMEAQMKEERKAQWMASLRGPGWARRGRCHGV